MAEPKIESAAQGAVMIIFHGHVPFVRQPQREFRGEEPLHRLISESYLPLLMGLTELIKQGQRVKVGLALSPILLEQLADPVVQKHLWESLTARLSAAKERLARAQSDHERYLAQFYLQQEMHALGYFEKTCKRNLLIPIRDLIAQGVIEPLVHTATYVVPGIHDRGALRVQYEVGQLAAAFHCGRRPTVAWAADEPFDPTIASLLEPLGINGIIANIAPDPESAYVWANSAKTRWCIQPSRRLAQHLTWEEWGYPGDLVYREPRSADRGVDSARSGAPYDPFYAYARARLHARHFVALLDDQRLRAPVADRPALIVLAVDLEVLGSGWYEGGMWLRTVLEELQRHPFLQLVTPSQYASEHAPEQTLTAQPRPGGMIDGALHTAIQRLRETIVRNPRAEPLRERILNQAARELLLAQSGDWDRWQSSPDAAQYAVYRRETHIAHVHDLLRLANETELSWDQEKMLSALEEQNNPFRFLNYHLYNEQEPR